MTILKDQQHLTLTYDGNTTTGNENYYSFHATTMDGVPYLLALVEGSDESHTGEWICQKAMTVCCNHHIHAILSYHSPVH
jgi:hypothetical protein